MTEKKKFNLPVTLFLVLTPIIGILGSIAWVQNGHFNWSTIILALVLFSFMEISITAGYHRLFAHRSYKANWLVRAFFLFFGAGAFQGPAIYWAMDHRVHHHHVDDNDKDPYSINKGFMWAHMIWLFYKRDPSVDDPSCSDLREDPLVMFQHNYYNLIAAFACFGVPALLAMIWGDAWGGFIVAGSLRAVVVHHSTFLINSLSHCMGKQTYSDRHSARDNWFTAFLTFGEGYHNYHHEFPTDYRNGIRKYHWDPTKWLIYILSRIGFTSNLRRVAPEVYLRKRMMMTEKRLARKAPDSLALHERVLMRLKERMEEAGQNLHNLSKQLQNLNESNREAVVVEYESKVLEEKLEEATRQLRHAFKMWNTMTKRVMVRAS